MKLVESVLRIFMLSFYAVKFDEMLNFWSCEIRNFWEDPLLIVTYLQWKMHILKLLWRLQVYEHRNCLSPSWLGQIKTIDGSFYFDISMDRQSHHGRVYLGKMLVCFKTFLIIRDGSDQIDTLSMIKPFRVSINESKVQSQHFNS